MSLKKKTLSGLKWSFLSQAGRQLTQFLITALLARLLLPNDFGLVAMATIFVNCATIFSDMGISSALIQKQNITRDTYYSSAFWLNVISGCFLTIIFVIATPLIAKFYKKPELIPILYIVSLNFIISSTTIIQQVILTKAMEFKKLAIRDITAVLCSGVIAVFLAWRGFGVWSLVYQLIIFAVLNSALLWFLSDWRPKFFFSINEIKDIFHFSAHVTGFNIVNYFARNVDQLLIGKFLGSQALGFYSLAYKIMLYPLQNISWVISKVMFPAFSKIQFDLEKVKDTYLKMIKLISLITFPAMTILFVIAPEFVRVIFGQRWEPAIILIRILCFCGMFQSITTTSGVIIMAMGKASMLFRLGALGALLTTICIFVGFKWGMIGVAVFYAVEQIVWGIYIQYHIVNKLIALPNQSFPLTFFNSIIISLITGLTVATLKYLFCFSDLVGLFIYVFFGAVIYFGSLWCCREIKSATMFLRADK